VADPLRIERSAYPLPGEAKRGGALQSANVAIAPVSGALSVLASGLQQARTRQDADAQAIASDPFALDAVLDLSLSSAGLKAMAAAYRTVADTQTDVIDLLA
jgi:hypothetical protein